MQDEDLQPLLRQWAANRLDTKPEAIHSVEFGTVYGGYCETCRYETFGADIRYTNGQYTQIEDDAADIMRELFALRELPA